jgi:diguanylate cyclase (GGDEF)-like protein
MRSERADMDSEGCRNGEATGYGSPPPRTRLSIAATPAEGVGAASVRPGWTGLRARLETSAQVAADHAGSAPTWTLRPADGGATGEARVLRLEQELALARLTIRRLMDDSGVDPLTGLLDGEPIRRCVDLEMRRAQRHGREVAVLLVDVDRLGAINEVKGRSAGDAILRALAQRLREGTRSTDTVGRAGSDEFIVVCPETDAAGAARVAEKLISEAARSPVVVAGASVHLSVCIGVVPVTPGIGMTRDDVLDTAVSAVQRAKKGGCDRWSL